MGGLLLSWRLRAFFCCDGLLGEVRRRVLLLLWCRYAADLDRLVWGTSTGLRSGMRGAARLLDVGPCGGGCVVLAGVPFCGVGVTLPCSAAWGRACYSIEHLRLARVPLVPILNAIAQQGARGATRSHSSGREDNLALCAPLALACVDEGGYSLALAHVVTCSATEAAGAASRRARLHSCGCELVLYSPLDLLHDAIHDGGECVDLDWGLDGNGGDCWGNIWRRWRRRLRRCEWHIRSAHDHVVGGFKDVGEGIRVVWEVVNKLLLQVLSNARFQGWRQASEEVPRLLYRGDTVPGDKVAGDEEVLVIVFA